MNCKHLFCALIKKLRLSFFGASAECAESPQTIMRRVSFGNGLLAYALSFIVCDSMYLFRAFCNIFKNTCYYILRLFEFVFTSR